MKRIFQSAAVVVLTLGLPATAQAQMVVATDPASVAGAVQAAGYRAETTKEKDGTPMINSGASGSGFSIYFNGCKNANCDSLVFATTFNKRERVTQAWINDWNSRKRYVRAYLSADGQSQLEMDVNLDAGGISRALFLDYLDIWVLQLETFKSEIGPQ